MNPFWFKGRPVHRVLLIHPYGIGDALWITPVIRALKEQGAGEIDLLLGSRTREVFENNPNVHHIFEWNKVKPKKVKALIQYFIHLGRMFFRIWCNHYDAVFDFSPAARSAFAALFFFWIPVRVGFNFRGRGFFLTHKIDLINGFSDKPMAEYYLDLVRSLGVETSNPKPEFFLSEDDQAEAERLLETLTPSPLSSPPRRGRGNGEGADRGQSFIVVAPGGGESWGNDARLKRWPVHNFAALIQMLTKQRVVTPAKAGVQMLDSRLRGNDSGLTILILGSKMERNLGEELVRQVDETAINLCGETSLGITAGLLQKSLFLLANDSGIVHLAHALGVPVVSIFGPVDPGVYGPYPKNERALIVTGEGPICRPCYQRFRYQRDCSGVECLTHLTPEKVFEEIETSRFLSYVKSAVSK